MDSVAGNISIGDKLPVVEKAITGLQIKKYAAVSGDHNPVHLDETFAAKSSFGRIVAHGMLTLAFLSEMMTKAFGVNWLENGQMKVKFRKPAYPGDRVRTGGEVVRTTKCGQLKTIYCQLILLDIDDGEEIISGAAEVTIPIE